MIWAKIVTKYDCLLPDSTIMVHKILYYALIQNLFKSEIWKAEMLFELSFFQTLRRSILLKWNSIANNPEVRYCEPYSGLPILTTHINRIEVYFSD